MGPIETRVMKAMGTALSGTAVATVTQAAERGDLFDVMDDMSERDRFTALMAACVGLTEAVRILAQELDERS
jgi:hypothetical protein